MKILIDTDWAMFIADLPTDKQLEFFWAVFDYGNRDCNLKCWDKVKPILEKGKIGYYNKLKKLKQFTVLDTDTDTDTDTVRGSVSVRERKQEKKEYIPVSGIRAKNVPTEDEVLEYARQQNEMAGVGGFTCPPDVAHDFYDYYTGIGWVVPNDTKTPIVDWKPFLRKWARNPNKFRRATNESEKRNIDDLNNFVI